MRSSSAPPADTPCYTGCSPPHGLRLLRRMHMLSSHDACGVSQDSELADRPTQNPYLFLVAFPGSGLSLLGRWLDSHRRLTIAPGLDWLTDYFMTSTGLNLEGLMTSELVAK